MGADYAYILPGLFALVTPLGVAAESIGRPTFAWPLEGHVMVPEGTEVLASLAGTVIYAGGGLQPFGNLILVRHAGGWGTIYGHNSGLFGRSPDRRRHRQERQKRLRIAARDPFRDQTTAVAMEPGTVSAASRGAGAGGAVIR